VIAKGFMIIGGGAVAAAHVWRQKLGGGGATTLVGTRPIHAETRDRYVVASVLACFAKGADLLNRHVQRSRACARRDRDRDRTRRRFHRVAVKRGAYRR